MATPPHANLSYGSGGRRPLSFSFHVFEAERRVWPDLSRATRAGVSTVLCGYLNNGSASIPYLALISSNIGPTTSGRPSAPDRVKQENPQRMSGPSSTSWQSS